MTATGVPAGYFPDCTGIVAEALTINGGNVTATGTGVIGVGIFAGDGFTITGGNINARGNRENLSGISPKNAAGDPVFETVFTGLTENAAVTVTSPSYYGTDGLKTNSDSEFYMYAPAGEVSITVGGTPFSAVYYGIFVGGVAVTDKNYTTIAGGYIKSGSASYDPDNATLTLTNAVIEPDDLTPYAIASYVDITVELAGANVLGVITSDYTLNNIGTGIYAPEKNITLTGAGNLAIYDILSGIEGENVTIGITGTLTVRESGGSAACTLKADGGILTIQSGTLDLLSYTSNALYGDSIVINGGTITAQGLDLSEFGAFAFNDEPTFGDYEYKVWAGNSTASAVEVASPDAITFTGSKYVRIGLLAPTPGPGPGGGATVVTPLPKTETTTSGNTTTATTTVTATVNNSGTATADVTQAQVSEAITKAVEAAAQQGDGTSAVVEIKVTAPADAKTVETIIPGESMELVADGKITALTVSTPIASLSFDAAALSTIAGEAAGVVNVSASIVEASTLSADTQNLIGDRPVYNFSVTSGGKAISQFGGSVSVSVPYTPTAGEDLNAIIIYYINAEGKTEIVSNCVYDPATGTISFKTSHFSQYAVGYNKVTFKDVAENAWYCKAVGFIAARGVTTGTGNGNYSPDAKLTRGEFIVMLMKAYGIAPDTAPADNFADAGSTYYTGYLAAAKRLSISSGVGNNLFAPGKEITRQEMFTLLYNALKTIGELPEGNAGKPLSAFSDAGQIASWAKDAMKLMIETGTVSDIDGKLAPEATTTRAQMAKMLYNLMTGK